MMYRSASSLAAIAFAAAAGCMIGDTSPLDVGPATVESPVIPADVFETLNPPAAAHAELCANDGAHPLFPNDADRITKQFCQDLVPGGAIPNVHGLADLQALLGLSFVDRWLGLDGPAIVGGQFEQLAFV